MKVRNLILLSVALFSAAFAQAATVDTLSVWSASMNKGVEVVVVVPDGARTKTGPAYPVLYLLHGYSGYAANWLQVKPELVQLAERDSVIVVCPDGKNSWYWDSPSIRRCVTKPSYRRNCSAT